MILQLDPQAQKTKQTLFSLSSFAKYSKSINYLHRSSLNALCYLFLLIYQTNDIQFMKLLLITLLIAISSAFSITSQQQLQTVQWPFTVCGNGTWTMKNLTLDHVVTRNANDDIDAVGIANDYTQFAKVDIKVTLNGLFLHSQTVDFVKTYDQGDLINFTYTTFIPSFAPSGTYALSYTFKDPQGKENGCFSFTFKL